jgi:pimeloyl-ACP methyl ester carboxylesterase
LNGLRWVPSRFDVDVVFDERAGYFLARYPAPLAIGNHSSDEAICRWYPAIHGNGQVANANSVVVLHETGPYMIAGTAIAKSLARRGFHAFMVLLPGYGERTMDGHSINLIDSFRRGIADARRARDVIRALPFVESSRVAIQGTSLGGFAASITASIDNAFERVFLVLSGGDLFGVLTSGSADAREILERLKVPEPSLEEIEKLLRTIEPLRLAHRLDPAKTFLYRARLDRVVLPKYSRMLADLIGLRPNHNRAYWATHYSGVLQLPGILAHVSKELSQLK